MKRTIVSTLLVCFSTVFAAGTASAADVEFFEKNGCRGKVIFAYDSNHRSTEENCKASGKSCSGRNDAARSMRVNGGANAPSAVYLYDSPGSSEWDDYWELRYFPRTIGGYATSPSKCFHSFEASFGEPPYYVATTHIRNGLDGKVSHIKIYWRPLQR